MNEKPIPASADATDEQILRAIRQRMAGVEPMIPVPPAWDRSEPVSRRLRPVVRSGVRFAIAPLVLVAVIVALALAGGMVNGPVAVSTPGSDYLEQTYRVVNPSGAKITPDQLDLAAEVLRRPATGWEPVPSGVTKVGSDALLVKLPGNYTPGGARLGLQHVLNFVLLPPETYGTADVPGPTELPAKGTPLMDMPTPQFTSADLDPGATSAAVDPSSGGTWIVNFKFRDEKAIEFETWTGRHVNDYLAITLDNVVLTTPYIKAPIMGGSGQITGLFTQDEAKDLARAVEFAALGLTFELVDAHQYLGPNSTAHPAVTAPPMSGSGSQPTQAAAPLPLTSLPAPAYTLGSGPIQMDVWLDFKCSACKDFEQKVLPQVITDFVDTGRVTMNLREDIVTLGDTFTGGHEALDAANAARCAGDQGKYREYAQLVFAGQGSEGDGSLTKDHLIALAAQLPIDQAAFATCVRDGLHDAAVSASVAAAQGVGASGVPAVAVAGQLLPGPMAPDYVTISSAIQSAETASAAATFLPAAAASAASNVPAEISPRP